MNTSRKVIALAPMPPEKSAYALARYSRSPDSIEESLRWVHEHSSERFWEQFYFAYGHGSIADLGHVTICFENITELAAIHIEDEPLWDGQAKSSRYQDFTKTGVFIPPEIKGSMTEAPFLSIAEQLTSAYASFYESVNAYLLQCTPRPESMQVATYERTMKARTLDVTRYFLPLASYTNVGQVVSIRTLEKQISRLLASHIPELVAIGKELLSACRSSPVNIWNELVGGNHVFNEPLAPTLARHAKARPYYHETMVDLTQVVRERLRFKHIEPADSVELFEPHHPLDELVVTLLYRVSQYSYRQILRTVESWLEHEKNEIVELSLRRRGPYDELLREFHSGYAFVFDILMDVGGWRDLHRHRRCQQIPQEFTTVHGYEVPKEFEQAGLDTPVREIFNAVLKDIDELQGASVTVKSYLLPFATRMRCLFKMDFAEAEYISRLRTGVKGHASYRRIGWLMKERLAERYPFLGDQIRATHPNVEDTLTR
ncbi:MAG: alternative thymidylate synthase-like protein [Nitrospiraceae bacterium]|nr:alternative thymidylate synthase-like protein [Nitrospiraceae bacterium]